MQARLYPNLLQFMESPERQKKSTLRRKYSNGGLDSDEVKEEGERRNN